MTITDASSVYFRLTQSAVFHRREYRSAPIPSFPSHVLPPVSNVLTAGAKPPHAINSFFPGSSSVCAEMTRAASISHTTDALSFFIDFFMNTGELEQWILRRFTHFVQGRTRDQGLPLRKILAPEFDIVTPRAIEVG